VLFSLSQAAAPVTIWRMNSYVYIPEENEMKYEHHIIKNEKIKQVLAWEIGRSAFKQIKTHL